MTRALCTTSRLAMQSEQDLVAAVRTGDDRAFEQLHARYWEPIFSFILGRVHDHGRAEDVAQEVFISALRRLRSDDRRVALKPWLYEIAKNACVDEFRRCSRSREVPLPDDAELLTERLSPSSAAPTPVAAVASRQQLDDLRGAFGGLSDGHHQLLVMREFDGLSYDEIGERLGMTRQMVESGLFRARRKLTEEYEELASGRRCEQVQSAIEAGTLCRSASLGVRERRRVARHLAHCQPCRHVALMAGVDEALVKPRSIAARIAALLPLPFARWPWSGGGHRGGARAAASGAQHHATATAPLQGAAGLAQPAASAGLAPTVAAVAALAITGVGGGLLHVFSGSAPPHHPPHVARQLDRGEAGAVPVVSPRQAEKARPPVRTPAHDRFGPAGPDSGSGSGLGTPGSPTETGPAPGGRGGAQPTAAPSGAQAMSVPRDPAGVAGAAGSAVNGGGGTGTAGSVINGVSGAARSVTGAALGSTASSGQGVVGGVIKGVQGAVGTVTSTAGAATTATGQTLSGAGAAVSGAGATVSGTVNGVIAGAGSTVAGATGTPSGSGAATGASGSTAGSPLSGAAQSVASVGTSAAKTVSTATGLLSSGASTVTKPVSRTLSGLLPK